jgi:hypothetical protein
LLLAVDPACQDEKQQLPGLKDKVHISPDVELVQRKASIGYLQSRVNHKTSKFWHWLY